MKKKFLVPILLLLGLPFAQAAQAIVITSSLSNVSGNTWQYDYNLSTPDALLPGNGFSVFFEAGKAENLLALPAPAGWDVLVVEPGSFIGDSPGFYDALSLNGLGAGETAGIFSVQFDWLLSSLPPSDGQAFEFYFLDLASGAFESIDMGQTSPVPLPAAFWLFASAIAGLGILRRRGSIGLQKG